MRTIETPRDLSQAMREINKLNYSPLGSYTLVFVCADGEVMRPSSALTTYKDQLIRIRDRERDRIVGIDVFWEGPALIDCETNETIESAYGDPAEND